MASLALREHFASTKASPYLAVLPQCPNYAAGVSGASGAFGFFAAGDGDSRTTVHVTPAASAITQTMKTATPMRPSTVANRLRIAACLARA